MICYVCEVGTALLTQSAFDRTNEQAHRNDLGCARMHPGYRGLTESGEEE